MESLKLDAGKYFVVSTHREENVDNPAHLRAIFESLNAIVNQYGQPIVVSTHPRTRNRLEELKFEMNPLIRLQKPLGFLDYNALQLKARAVLSDSGTISEESSILGFPALNIRQAHERPEAMEEAVVMMTGLSETRIVQALEILLTQKSADSEDSRAVADYSMPNVSDKVVRIIQSYTDYINRVVWQKRD